MKPIKKLAIVINATKPGAEALAESLSAVARSVGTEVLCSTEYPVPKGLLKGFDACCVLGGDGTILGVVPEAIEWQVPVFGLNQGKLGFLASMSLNEADEELRRMLAGNYQTVMRSILHCTAGNGQEGMALNDTVIKSASVSRLMSLSVFSDGELVTEYSCDGLIFCTPTGSTAYNLSAGGPIITPGAGIMAMTPICPHTLTNRSVVFGYQSVLRVTCPNPDASAHVSLDGRQRFSDCEIFPLTLKIMNKSMPLLLPMNYSYYSILRNKLKWGGNDTPAK